MLPMRLVFRADASPLVGSGHVMRLSAIAEEAISQGIETVFLGRISNVDWLQSRIAVLGFSQICLPEDFSPDSESDFLILDSYHVQVNDSLINGGNWKKVVAITDELTPIYQADTYIHPGFDSSWFQGDKSKLFSGPRYFPLRKSIDKVNATLQEDIKKILIFGGGTDPFGFALSLSKVLTNVREYETAVFFTDSEEVRKLDHRFSVEPFGASLDLRIDESDLVLTTASTSSLEVLARGLPIGVACATENQISYHKSLIANGFATDIGFRKSQCSWEFNPSNLAKLINDSSFRMAQVYKSKGVIDTLGASRCLEVILALA